jgi:hypothetical protein
MGKKILFRRNTLANMGDLDEGSPFWAKDKKILFVGDSTGSGGTPIGYTVTNVYDQTSFDAIASITTATQVVIAPGAYSVSADITFPVESSVYAPNGVLITIDTGKTLTINGPFEAGLYQVFNCVGTGKVVFSGSPSPVYSIWFGSGAAGIHTALDSDPNELIITPGTYEDVTIDLDDFTLYLSEGVVFKTSSSGLVPAIKFNGCDRLEVRGRLVANGNKANNIHAYTDSSIGYEYATVAFYNSTYIQVGDIYVYNAWHDGVTLDTVTFSNFGDMVAKDSYCRGVVLYQSTSNNSINNIKVNTTILSKGVRFGGASAVTQTDNNQINSINVYLAESDGVLIERYTSNLQISNIRIDTTHEGNGVKIEDATYISIGSITTNKTGHNGFFINASQNDVSHINIGSIASRDAGEEAGAYSGVFISANTIYTTKNVIIGQIIAESCGTTGGHGVRIENDGSGIIENISIVSIIANNNFSMGVFVDDSGTNQNISFGDIISMGNGVGGFRVEYGVDNCTWGSVITDSVVGQQNQVGYARTGNRGFLDVSYADAATVSTGEDNLTVKTIGSGVMGATGGIKIKSAGTIAGTNNNKVIKLHFGASSWTVISAAAADETDWEIEASIVNTATNAQRIMWRGIESDGTIKAGYETAAIDTTANVVLKLTGECTNSTDVITQRIWTVERL